MDGMQDVTLDNIAGGAAMELFEREWARVLYNIQDPNTSPKQKREIVIKVIVAPNEDRSEAVVGVLASAKLASARPAATTVFMGRRDGEIVAVAYDPRQGELFPGDHAASRVLPLDRREP